MARRPTSGKNIHRCSLPNIHTKENAAANAMAAYAPAFVNIDVMPASIIYRWQRCATRFVARPRTLSGTLSAMNSTKAGVSDEPKPCTNWPTM